MGSNITRARKHAYRSNVERGKRKVKKKRSFLWYIKNFFKVFIGRY